VEPETGVDEELEERAVPFRALFEHWERTRWSLGDLTYDVDRASFEQLDDAGRDRMRFLFAHRFDGESIVAGLMTPFVAAAPDLDVGLLMSTQLVDEMRHVKAIVRIYEEVFGVSGGMPVVQALADEARDPATAQLYDRLESWIEALAADPSPDAYLRAVTAYHIVGEGVVARVSTQLSTPLFQTWGEFPGILAGQRLVSRDESRHIGIGVTYARRAVAADPERAWQLIGEVVTDSVGVFEEIVAAVDGEFDALVSDRYGASSGDYFAAAQRLLGIRMRSIGAPVEAAAVS
jgi:ribonucleoside-diphosphate reductase beta chain